VYGEGHEQRNLVDRREADFIFTEAIRGVFTVTVLNVVDAISTAM
jgi:hypothetical protein